MSHTFTIQHLSPEVAHYLLEAVPDYVKIAFSQKAAEMDCSLEAVVEMALASFVDDEAFSFEDCLIRITKDCQLG